MRKRMKKSLVYISLVAGLVTGILTGCDDEEKVDYSIDGVEEELQTENDGSHGGKCTVSQFMDEPKWSEVWTVETSEGETVEITVEADIILPDTKEMSVVEVTTPEMDADFKERIMKEIFDGEEVFYHDEKHLPKKELEELYAMYEEWYMAADTESSQENMKEEMEACAKLIENASETYTPAVDYEVNEYIGEINGITYELGFSWDFAQIGWDVESQRFYLYAKYIEEICPDIYENYSHYMAHPYMTCDRYTKVFENECGLSQKEAEELASGMLKELGLEYPVLSYTKPLIWGDETLSSENIYDWPANGYVFTFEYGLEDVSFTGFGTNYDYYNLVNSTEDEVPQYSLMASADVYVTDKGVIGLYAYSPVETESISESVELLPLDTIKEIMKEEMEKRYEDFGFQYVMAENQLEFTYMELIYFRVRDKENQGCYSYIPAWRLSDQIGDVVQNNRSIRNPVIVNAIDGTLIRTYDEM